MATNKTIAIAEGTKKKLESLKVHPRETFDDVLNRLIDKYRETRMIKED